MKGNYQDFQRYTEVDLAIAADAEATLPSLIEAVKRLITDDRRTSAPGSWPATCCRIARKLLDQARTAATYGWDASPVSTARLSAELWAQIKDKDWSLVSDVRPG